MYITVFSKILIESAFQAIYRMVSNGKDTPAETAEQRTERIFIQMDKNKDGVLTKQEFINGCLSDDVLCSMLTASAASK